MAQREVSSLVRGALTLSPWNPPSPATYIPAHPASRGRTKAIATIIIRAIMRLRSTPHAKAPAPH